MLMARCVEDCHRFMSGQMEMENSTRILEHPRELWHELNELQSLVTPGISKGASYDWAGNHCPNREQKKFIAETYYLYRKIYEKTICERAKTEKFPLGNTYLSETLRCKDSGEPIKVEVMEDAEIRQYTQDWANRRRIILVSPSGSVMVDIDYNTDEHGAGAFIWGLFVGAKHRRCGVGKKLLGRAEDAARWLGQRVVALEWERPTPQWVYDWYVRSGYEEKEFGDGCAKLYKSLEM